LPLYEYGCPSCGLVTDVRHGFDEKPDVTCERCGTRLVRRFSAAPIVFKGSGFYVTDSRKKSASSSGDREKPESKTDSPKTDSPKTDSPTTSTGTSTSGDGAKKNGEAAA
jgi:putative FmdB family regulatory protein